MLELKTQTTDTRLVQHAALDRCKHPRLRQALMFQPVKPQAEIPKPVAAKVFKPQIRKRVPTSSTLRSFKGALAVAWVRVMEVLFDGVHFVTEPV